MTFHDKNKFLIIGAGLSGLSVAHFLKKARPDAHITILEKSNRVGGAIQSFQKDGFTAELGAHGFLSNCIETNELLDDLNLTDKALRAPLKKFSRYVCLSGRLNKLPQSPLDVIFGSFMSLPAKFRLLADLWVKPTSEEQTIAQWVKRRFGCSVLPFADVAATGTYAGDINKLSIDAVMPRLREMEKKNGSVIRGFVGNTFGQPRGVAPTGLPSMLSFENGMEVLCVSLANGLDIRFGQTVQKMRRDGNFWEVIIDQGVYKSDQVILATSINAALPLLSTLLPTPVDKIPEARLVNVLLGFDASVSIPHAFGYLAPESEKRFALGVMFSSKMFPPRAPQGHVLLEALVGGRRHPERCDLCDDELIQGALFDLEELLNIRTEPLFAHVLRPTAGIPQLEMGHSRLWKYKNDLETQFSNLNILGFGWHGIGMNDMTKEAKRVVGHICGQNVATTESLKKVYF